MSMSWVTIAILAILVFSTLSGLIHRFGRQSRSLVGQILNIVVGLVSIAIGWVVSRRVAAFVSHQNANTVPHWTEQLLVQWQHAPRIGTWITFVVCYFVLSGIIKGTLGRLLHLIPFRFPRPIENSRLLGAGLGLVTGVVRSALVGALVFTVLQYFSAPGLSKQLNASPAYQALDTHLYTPILKPIVAKEMPVLQEKAIQPLSKNIDVFVVPTGTNGNEAGVLLVPKQIAQLSQQITKGMTDPKAKAKALYEWEIHHISYNWKKYDDYVYHGKWDAQSPLQTLKTGKGVCADYALLYANLAHAAGLSVKIDEGIGKTGGESGSHAWNEVYLPSQKKWIYVDTTWGSTQDAWFDVPAAKFDQTHIEQKSIVIHGGAST